MSEPPSVIDTLVFETVTPAVSSSVRVMVCAVPTVLPSSRAVTTTVSASSSRASSRAVTVVVTALCPTASVSDCDPIV